MSSVVMTIIVTDEIAALIRGAARSGDYSGVSDVVREALREWRLTHAAQIAGRADMTTEKAATIPTT
jgi:Arc/MetJ-type ribon-helix-helix transcriptional regulator